jgi:glycyl-tRNA synthetase
MVTDSQMAEFVGWAKRRGFAWVDSEIYGGLGSFYDYGPIGVEMKNRLKAHWWRSIITNRDDVVGLESSIIMNPEVWRASGHLENFTDPLVEDTVTHKRYRADQLADPTKSPDGNPLTEPADFNTMFKTAVGPVEDEGSTAYLRPETAQGTFINFKQVMETSRLRPPFGIAQVGKSFRNEITPGNFTYRTREFEQMELEFFVPKAEATTWFEYWINARLQWYVNLGISKDNLRLFKHPKAKLSHYSKGTTDIEYKFPWGWGELEGIANRGDYDLTQHQQFSGKDMTVFDEETQQRFIPWVIEPAGGVDRALLALTLDAWQLFEKGRKGEGESETVMAINPELAAYDAAVLPLVKKEPLLKIADQLVKKLRAEGKHVFYDQSGSIGRRYRRQDEIGTPICYTIDFQSVEDGTVTLRDRDSMKQKRISLA